MPYNMKIIVAIDYCDVTSPCL